MRFEIENRDGVWNVTVQQERSAVVVGFIKLWEALHYIEEFVKEA